MPEGIDTGSFDFYEGIRIFIPGAIAVAAADGIRRTIDPGGNGFGFSTASALVATLIVGLLFYAVDAPAKSAIIVPDRPSGTLFSWGAKPKPGTKTLNIYFVMLDRDLPSAIRARSLYMGSMFRIGFEAVYLFAASGVLALSARTWSGGPVNPSLGHLPKSVWAGAAIIVAVWRYACWRDNKTPADLRTVSDNRDDLFIVLGCVAAYAALMWGLRERGWEVAPWALGVPAGIAFALWATRYYRGYVEPGHKGRTPISAAHACFLLGSAQILTLATLVSGENSHVRLSNTEVRAWLAVMAVSMVLVCSRGHEKRLRGAYATQNTWLTLNKDKVIADYFVPTPPADDDPVLPEEVVQDPEPPPGAP